MSLTNFNEDNEKSLYLNGNKSRRLIKILKIFTPVSDANTVNKSYNWEKGPGPDLESASNTGSRIRIGIKTMTIHKTAGFMS
jgi:hypothetical protein